MVFQANRYYGAPQQAQQAHNEHAFLTNEKRDKQVERLGDIKQAPSKFTQFWRGVKNAPSGPLNMIKNLVSTAAVVAPIPSLGKIKAIKKLGAVIKHNANIGTFGQTVRTASLFGAKGFKSSFGKVDDALINRTSGNMPKSTSQNLQSAFSYPREALGALPKSNIKTASNHPAAVTFRETGKTPTQVFRETGKFTTGDFHKLGN